MEQGVCFIKFRDHTKLGGITSILEAMNNSKGTHMNRKIVWKLQLSYKCI